MICISEEKKSSMERCIQCVLSKKQANKETKGGMLPGCMYREKGMDKMHQTTNMRACEER